MPETFVLADNAPFTPSEFREDFPAFSDPAIFPDQRVIFYTNLAALNLTQSKWGQTWTYGCGLYVAHNLAIENHVMGDPNNPSGSYGYGAGGVASGGTKTVGRVSKSVSYDTTFYKNAGDYAETEWGRILWRFIKMFGAGGMTVWNTVQKRSKSLPTLL